MKFSLYSVRYSLLDPLSLIALKNMTSFVKLFKFNRYPMFEYKVVQTSSKTFFMEIFIFPNTHYSRNKLLGGIYKTLINIPEFKEFAETKVVLISGYSEEQWFTIGRSFVITSNTKLSDFTNHYKKSLGLLADLAYPVEYFDIFAVKVGRKHLSTPVKTLYNFTQCREMSTMVKNLRLKTIAPLNSVNRTFNKLGVIDIETIVINGVLIPYAIGYRLIETNSNNIITKMFYLADFGSKHNISEASKRMIRAFVEDFSINAKGYHIYVHNLGHFDGYLLLRPFYEVLGNYNVLMDKMKAVISMDLPGNISIRDSLRILPSSLAELSKQFNVPTPKTSFDHNSVNTWKIFNSRKFRRLLEDYLSNDLISLLDVMISATKHIHQNYGVDLSRTFSTSSLAMQIYRTKFMEHPIPLLPKHVDRFVRNSYRGGATDIYKCFGEGLYYYDVNSLYPMAMLNPMPYEFLGVRHKPNLNNFFGFIYAKVTVPSSVKVPVLPWKDPETEDTIYPRGFFTGHYFSEELKAVEKLGYKVECYIGYEFSQQSLFNEYVNHFYEAKSKAKGSERMIVKLLLNSLYGNFGRSLERWNFEFLTKEEAANKMFYTYAHEVVELNENHLILVSDTTPSRELLEAQGKSYKDYFKEFSSTNSIVFTNVAVASAVTSYSRIAIIPVKTNITNPCFYSDTDSVFVQNPLPQDIVGSGLGQFKDELKGETILEAIFLNKKFYGYRTSTHSKVVIAGAPTKIVPSHTVTIDGKEVFVDSYKTSQITFEQLRAIRDGATIVVRNNDTIHKSLKNLNLRQHSSNFTAKFNTNLVSKTPVFCKGKLIAFKPYYVMEPPKLASLHSLYYNSIKTLRKMNKNILRILSNIKFN